jgi:hypothetical protein
MDIYGTNQKACYFKRFRRPSNTGKIKPILLALKLVLSTIRTGGMSTEKLHTVYTFQTVLTCIITGVFHTFKLVFLMKETRVQNSGFCCSDNKLLILSGAYSFINP